MYLYIYRKQHIQQYIYIYIYRIDYGNIQQYILELHPSFCWTWYLRPDYENTSGLMSLVKFQIALLFLENMENQVKLTRDIRPDVFRIMFSYRIQDFRLQGFRVSYTVFLTIYMNIYVYILRNIYAGYGTSAQFMKTHQA